MCCFLAGHEKCNSMFEVTIESTHMKVTVKKKRTQGDRNLCSIVSRVLRFLLAVEEVPKTPESEKPLMPKIPRKCCTMEELKERPEIVLWYLANMISYLGFFMPFLNLVCVHSWVFVTLLTCFG